VLIVEVKKSLNYIKGSYNTTARTVSVAVLRKRYYASQSFVAVNLKNWLTLRLGLFSLRSLVIDSTASTKRAASLFKMQVPKKCE
jgi:hypothetical protein